jgi:hypothetical protein
VNEIISPFEKLLADLTAAGIDFAVVGGVAVIANGYGRLTEDLDILVSDSPENLVKLLDVLGRFGEGFARELTPADFPRQEGSIRIVEDFALDVFTLMRGRTLDDFRPQLRRREVHSCSFLHLAPEQLIQLKQGSWREKDQIDVAAMKEVIERERRAK